jgi:hypothetical protein
VDDDAVDDDATDADVPQQWNHNQSNPGHTQAIGQNSAASATQTSSQITLQQKGSTEQRHSSQAGSAQPGPSWGSQQLPGMDQQPQEVAQAI